LDEQVVESIPMDSFDRSLDAIVTPTELLLAPR
jgi:5-formyltetrahydrofolate cyclo-ligase